MNTFGCHTIGKPIKSEAKKNNNRQDKQTFLLFAGNSLLPDNLGPPPVFIGVI